eukprot:Rhum_TRINITY_DN16787_c0_g1::Rhum_TRINITY_DN16787_c0_g1_i1::g.164396::m.164396
MGFSEDTFEGLLEGHESPTYKMVYRLGMVTLVLFTIVGCILALCSDHGPTTALACVCAVGITVTLFTMIRWYRTDGMPSKFRHLIYCLMVLLLFLNAFNITLYTVKHVEQLTPVPTAAPPPPPCYHLGGQCPITNPQQLGACIQTTQPILPCQTPPPQTPVPME